MTRYLLDTHVFLWWRINDPGLSNESRAAISDPVSEILVSTVTAWELVIKQRIGKIELPAEIRSDPGRGIAEAVRQSSFEQLPISFEHAERILSLPSHHRDPFDHMLIAQAQIEDLTLVTHDKTLGLYEVPILWA